MKKVRLALVSCWPWIWQEGKLFHDTEIKDKLAAAQPFGEWVGKIKDLNDALAQVTEKQLFSGEELRKASDCGWL